MRPSRHAHMPSGSQQSPVVARVPCRRARLLDQCSLVALWLDQQLRPSQPCTPTSGGTWHLPSPRKRSPFGIRSKLYQPRPEYFPKKPLPQQLASDHPLAPNADFQNRPRTAHVQLQCRERCQMRNLTSMGQRSEAKTTRKPATFGCAAGFTSSGALLRPGF